MSDLEDELRRLLHDPKYALPSWPDAVTRVHAGMRVRRGRRWVARAFGSLTSFAAVLAIGGPVMSPTGPGIDLPSNAIVVPWQDVPYAEPPAAPEKQAAECRARDFVVKGFPTLFGGRPSELTYLLEYRGDAVCRIIGAPHLEATAPDGRRTTTVVPASSDENSVMVNPRDSVGVAVADSDTCANEYRDPDFSFSADDPTRIRLADRLRGVCRKPKANWIVYGGSGGPLPSPRETLGVAVRAPSQVRSGEEFTYYVVLHNPGIGRAHV